jgi:hypothetical protein
VVSCSAAAAALFGVEPSSLMAAREGQSHGNDPQKIKSKEV